MPPSRSMACALSFDCVIFGMSERVGVDEQLASDRGSERIEVGPAWQVREVGAGKFRGAVGAKWGVGRVGIGWRLAWAVGPVRFG